MRTLILVLGLAVLVGCPRDNIQQEPTALQSWAPGDVPSEHRAALEAADRAIAALKERLMPRLIAAMEKGGPEQAVEVCSEVAQKLTDQVTKETGVTVGRTSHKLRNPKNAPPPWARPFVESSKGKKAADASAVAVRTKAGLGVLRPIPVGGACLGCHGSDLPEPVRVYLAQKYPADQATGFTEGELRGWFWAETTN